MSINILHQANTKMSAVNNGPSISIVMPFEPMMLPKQHLELKLKQASRIVEKKMMKNYTAEQAFSVLLKLQILLRELNYNTLKKSIAIFLSSTDEQVLYFDMPVKEKVAVDESFGICDIILNKKQKIEYLILLLNGENSKMYIGNLNELQLIKSNRICDFPQDKNDIAQELPTFITPDNRKEILFYKFLHHMDQGLSLILRAYNLPVFIIAPERVLELFKKLTCNDEKFIALIHGDHVETKEEIVFKILQPYLKDWEKLKKQNILQEINKARNEHILSCGIEEVRNTAIHKNSRLLVIEKDFVTSKNDLESGQYLNRPGFPFYIKGPADDVIEKVLKNGGDVELVDKLENCEHNIALIQF